jgi:phosphoglycolate phosphatase
MASGALVDSVVPGLRRAVGDVLACEVLPVRLATAGFLFSERHPPVRALLAACFWADDRAIRLGAALELMDTVLRRMHGGLAGESGAQTMGLGDAAQILVGDYWTSGAFKLLVGLGDMRALQIVAAAATQASEAEVAALSSSADVALVRRRIAPLAEAAVEAAFALSGKPADGLPQACRFARHVAMTDLLLAAPSVDAALCRLELRQARMAWQELRSWAEPFATCGRLYDWIETRVNLLHPEAPQAFIIDLDGTLVDTLGDFVAVLNRVLTDLALPVVTRDFVERTIGQGSEHLIRSTLAHIDAEPTLYERAWALYQTHYTALNGQFSDVFPGVIEGLDRLQALGLPMACVTNKPAAFARDLLARKGLAGYFGWVFGGDSFERKKPDPLPLIKTCEALGTLPARCWMIGDSSNDARAARGAGCPVVLMRYGYNHGEPIDAVPALQHLDRLDALSLSPGPSSAAVSPAAHP